MSTHDEGNHVTQIVKLIKILCQDMDRAKQAKLNTVYY